MIRDILQHDKSREPICPRAEVLLFASSRAQLVEHVIVPALRRGVYVISDRFADSTTAYQGYGRGFPVEEMVRINNFAVGEAVPDITLLLDVDVELSLHRLANRGEGAEELDRIEREQRSFHERVRNGYLELAKRWPERIHVLDGRGDVDGIAAEIWALVMESLISKTQNKREL